MKRDGFLTITLRSGVASAAIRRRPQISVSTPSAHASALLT